MVVLAIASPTAPAPPAEVTVPETVTSAGWLPRPTPSWLLVSAETSRVRSVWDDLADCESGAWTADGHEPGSAVWDIRPGAHIFEGGLQFHPATWDAFRPGHFPDAAFDASRAQQIVVAERVLEVQGWKAWPVCSRRLGLRP